MRVGGLILARMGSERLPGKALRDLGGRPLIDHVVNRTHRIRHLNEVVMATSNDPSDDPLAEHGARLGVGVFRGDLHDLAGRVAACLGEYGWDYFVRLNGDSPLLMPTLIDRGIELARRDGLDLVTNLRPRTYPYGVAVEVVRTETFLRTLPSMLGEEREHVTSYFYRHPHQFQSASLTWAGGDASDIRLTVDDEHDLERLSQLMVRLRPSLHDATLADIVTEYRRMEARAAVA